MQVRVHVHVLCDLSIASLHCRRDRNGVQQANVGKLYNTLLGTEG